MICKDCTRRHVGCHAACKDYQQESAENARLREDRARARRLNADLNHCVIARYERSRKVNHRYSR